MKNLIKSLVAITALSVTAFTHAGVVTGTSDLVLGLTDGTTNVLINIGNINQYTTAAATQTVGSYGSLFTTAFGGDFSNVSWGVIGNAGQAVTATNGDPIKTIWASSAWDSGVAGVLGVQNSTAYDRLGNAAAGSANVNVASIYSALSGASAGQTNAGLKAVTLTNNVWDNQNGFNLPASITFSHAVGDVALGQTYSASDLFTIRPNGTAGSAEGAADSQFDGTFSISSTGVLTFTVIPEPSTYAMILGVATLGFAAIRRRKQANLLA